MQDPLLVEADVPDELDEAGEGLLADVDDVVGGHVELVTGQLKRVGQRDSQVAIGEVVQAAGGLVQNRGWGAGGVAGAAVPADLVGGPQSHRTQRSHGGWHGVSAQRENIRNFFMYFYIKYFNKMKDILKYI